MTQFDLSIEPFDQAAHRAPSRHGLFIRFVGRLIVHVLMLSIYAVQRLFAFMLHALLQRPFGATLAALCVWGGVHVGFALQSQAGPHPAPLFAKKDLTAKSLPSLPPQLFQASYYEIPAKAETFDVRAIQQLLSEKGFYKGAIDGQQGPMTAQAARDYQAQAGLEVNGKLDETLLDKLQNDVMGSAYETDDILIFTVQNRLNQLGFEAGPANGRFTKTTRGAIEKFETAHGLPVTGTIGSGLLRALTQASLNAKR